MLAIRRTEKPWQASFVTVSQLLIPDEGCKCWNRRQDVNLSVCGMLGWTFSDPQHMTWSQVFDRAFLRNKTLYM